MPSLNPNEKLVKLCLLQPGEQFDCPDLSQLIGTMTVLRVNDCAVRAYGQNREDPNDPWENSNRAFSCSCMVRPLGSRLEIKESSDGLRTVAGIENGAKRGRRAKHEVNFPEKEPFKIKELAEKLELEYSTVMNAFNKQRSNFKQIGSVPNGGRGKPLIIWQRK